MGDRTEVEWNHASDITRRHEKVFEDENGSKIGEFEVCGGKVGNVVAMHMQRSKMLIWLTYSIVLEGMAFLPPDSQYGNKWWNID
jgi:hypothetical protein